MRSPDVHDRAALKRVPCCLTCGTERDEEKGLAAGGSALEGGEIDKAVIAHVSESRLDFNLKFF